MKKEGLFHIKHSYIILLLILLPYTIHIWLPQIVIGPKQKD